MRKASQLLPLSSALLGVEEGRCGLFLWRRGRARASQTEASRDWLCCKSQGSPILSLPSWPVLKDIGDADGARNFLDPWHGSLACNCRIHSLEIHRPVVLP